MADFPPYRPDPFKNDRDKVIRRAKAISRIMFFSIVALILAAIWAGSWKFAGTALVLFVMYVFWGIGIDEHVKRQQEEGAGE